MRLFLYGTLQPQADTAIAAWVRARVVDAQPASVPGRLHGIDGGRGWYPALVRGTGRVPGTLCALRLTRAELALLDRYEGCEYRRVTLPVRTASGQRVPAQAYLWRLAVPRGAPVIAGGFAEWLGRTARCAYAAQPRDFRALAFRRACD
ncbi:gamma-glutamylcyclotransferase family protein [Novosphingobium soli]|uniref:Putative gamma-glutamylcyclotransferase n=1 Tax=Novosphingobium soli TaxID=574956 RepID=A0ABV6CRW8_9SPHN